MIKQIIGGVAVLVIGGTTYHISQSDVTKNFAQETGKTQAQAQQYVEDTQSNLSSFTKIGSDLVADGNSIIDISDKIDCIGYQYKWESPSLTCGQGKQQLSVIGADEVRLGDCYQALGTDLGNAGGAKIQECISDIDSANADYDLPIASKMLNSESIDEFKTSNLYNKSVLRAAIESN